MDDETFITHLLNSLPQSEYEGAILVIKDELRKGPVELPEIEQVLEDKYQAMKHTKGWEEEEDAYALFASPSNKNGPKNVGKPLFSIGLISSCADQYSSCDLLQLRIACLHVSYTTYEYFYKLSKSACFSRW